MYDWITLRMIRMLALDKTNVVFTGFLAFYWFVLVNLGVGDNCEN